MKKIALFLAALTVSAVMTSCGNNSDEAGSSEANSIYYLNFKPEVAEIYNEIAETYKKETGITLNVVTAASGTYEQTLKSEIAKADAPDIFQINGPKGYASWKQYCADLSGTEIYQHLTDKNLAITADGGVYGIPYLLRDTA